MSHWRGAEVLEVEGHWHARGEYVVDSGEVYSFDTTFARVSNGDLVEEKRRAELFISDLDA